MYNKTKPEVSLRLIQRFLLAYIFDRSNKSKDGHFITYFVARSQGGTQQRRKLRRLNAFCWTWLTTVVRLGHGRTKLLRSNTDGECPTSTHRQGADSTEATTMENRSSVRKSCFLCRCYCFCRRRCCCCCRYCESLAGRSGSHVTRRHCLCSVAVSCNISRRPRRVDIAV